MSDGPYHTCGFLFHAPLRQVLLHHRDARASALPGIWSFFCGGPEPEDCGDPIATWRREMHEEIGVTLGETDQVVLLGNYVSPQTEMPRFVFYCEWPHITDAFVIGEGDGVGWFSLEEALRLPDLPTVAKDDLRHFARTRGLPSAG